MLAFYLLRFKNSSKPGDSGLRDKVRNPTTKKEKQTINPITATPERMVP